MPLNSFSFLLFFAVVYGLYLTLPHRRQNALLLIASYCFYCFWDYRFLVLILISTTVDFWAARQIAATEVEGKRRGYLLLSIVTNLTILGFFKYFNFLLDSAAELLEFLGLDPIRWHLNIVVPIGISFYTFKTLSYTIGVYGRELMPTHRWVDYAAFVAFFPQLLSGPIDRASALLPQIENPRKITRDLIRTGIWLFFWGLFKKVVVADNLADVVAPAFSSVWVVSTSYAWTALYAFALQLYCDFSGYTDMARGVAMLFGFQTTVNFRNPFFASNPVEFWQRWHISLSQWIQDYIYFPLAAQALRRGTSAWHQYMPHICTMVLIGLWHGASWNFAIWGLYHGFLLIGHRLWRQAVEKLGIAGVVDARWLLPFWVALTFVIVTLGWIPFRAPDFAASWATFGALFAPQDWRFALAHPAMLIVPLGTLIFCLIDRDRRVQDWLVQRASLPAAALAGAMALLFLEVFAQIDLQVPFVYFQF